MAAGPTTTTTHADWIPEIWAEECFLEFESRTVFGAICQDDTAKLTSGDTINYEIVKDMGAPANINEAAGDTRTAEVLATAQNQVVVDQFKDKGFKISSPLEALSKYDVRAEYTPKLEYSMRKLFDQYMATTAAAASSHTAVDLTSLSTKTDAEIVIALGDAVKVMLQQDVPEFDWYWVFTPELEMRIRRILQFSSVDYSPVRAITEGKLPSIHGWPVLRSNLLDTETVSEVDLTYNLLIHKPSIRYAIPKGMEILISPRSAYLLHTWVAVEMFYGADSFPDDGTSNFGVVVVKTS